MSSTRRSRRTHAEMSDATKRSLLAHAREAFATRGYGATSLDDVAAAAGATKGAVYHHFDGKVGLFEAVIRQIHDEVEARVDALRDRSPEAGLLAILRTYLECLLDPGVRRLLLIESPAALDAVRERALDRELSFGPLHAHLSALRARGLLSEVDVEGLAHVVSGAVTAIALWMGESDDPERVLDRGLSTLGRLLGSLED